MFARLSFCAEAKTESSSNEISTVTMWSSVSDCAINVSHLREPLNARKFIQDMRGVYANIQDEQSSCHLITMVMAYFRHAVMNLAGVMAMFPGSQAIKDAL